jgi:hypothetical protein
MDPKNPPMVGMGENGYHVLDSCLTTQVVKLKDNVRLALSIHEWSLYCYNIIHVSGCE